MFVSQKIRLRPNNKQRSLLLRTCGVKRFVFNWGLAEWKRAYEGGGKPNRFSLKKDFNARKAEEFAFVSSVTKWAYDSAFVDLEKAFKNFFRRVKQGGKKPGYPKFKKKGVKDSFSFPASVSKVEAEKLKVPKLGWLRMRECLRFQGRVVSITISRSVEDWFASILVEVPDAPACDETQVHAAVGIDLGVSKLATLSDGTVFDNPKTTAKYAKKLRRANKALARKVKFSQNWKKAKTVLAKLHRKIARCRADAVHKMTAFIAANYSDVALEDLNSAGMVKNRKLAKAVTDAAFSTIRQQLEYKAIRVHFVDRWFPSTKLCPDCGCLNSMPLSQRVYECSCGYGPVDRDLHAARNILRQGLPKN